MLLSLPLLAALAMSGVTIRIACASARGVATAVQLRHRRHRRGGVFQTRTPTTTIATAYAKDSDGSGSGDGNSGSGSGSTSASASGAAEAKEDKEVIIESQAKTVVSVADEVPPNEIKGLMDELASREDLGKRGEGWFIVQAIATLGILVAPRALEILLHDLGFVLFPLGLIIIAISAGNLGFKNLSPFPTPRKSGQLKTKGLYGFVRHPMYSGLILTGLGVCLIVPSAARWICFGLLVIVLEKKMNFEDEELKQRFRGEYMTYVENVPGRIFPSSGNPN